jgi:methyl-accepting chemotaxis protein
VTVELGLSDRVVDEIRVESRARATDVWGMSSAVAPLDLMTQRNAALVEQGAAAADGMKSQTQTLLNALSSFRLEDVAPVDSA